MKNPYIIIGLTGPANAGKDTVADLLVTHAGFTKLAFADLLRDEVAQAFNIELIDLTWRATKEHPMDSLALSNCIEMGFTEHIEQHFARTGNPINSKAPRSPREIMQWWGTEFRRYFEPCYWVNSLEKEITSIVKLYGVQRIVVTDVRFRNESDFFKRSAWPLWQIKREGISVPVGAHESETTGTIFNPDVVIDNSHDMRHLQQQVLGAWWAYDAGLKSLKVEIEA